MTATSSSTATTRTATSIRLARAAGPENDLCEDAIEIVCPEGGGSVTVSGSTTDATFDGVGFCGTSNTAPGVWYKVTHDGLVTASTCNQASYDTKLSVYDGGCDALGLRDRQRRHVRLQRLHERGDLGRRRHRGPDPGPRLRQRDRQLRPHGHLRSSPIEGDFCEDAIGPLAVDSVTPGTTTGATLDEPPSIDCGTAVTAPGVWYTVDRHRQHDDRIDVQRR